MSYPKSKYNIYQTLEQIKNVSKTTNMFDIIRKNKEEVKKEKKIKIYSLLGFFVIMSLFVTIIYL
jgi:hypothetical protein|tara:strand:+ start:209 stop:403 length:195 start_codon:yes stop_codon:yes gene_type:complete